MFRNKVYLLLVMCFILVGTSAKSQIVIDDFSTDQALLFAVGAGSNSSSFVTTAGSDILGGERDLEVGVIAGAVSSGEITGGDFFFSVAAGSTGDSFLIYDGSDGLPGSSDLDPVGLGGVDLTAGGTLDSFQFSIESQDLPSTVLVQIYTDGVNFSSASVGVGVIPPGTPTDFVIPFTAFATAGGTGADFSNVGAVSMNTSGVTIDVEYNSLVVDASLNATMVDALLIDNDFDGMLSPGDTLRYTTNISNTDDALDYSINGVMFNVAPNSNANLVVGSVTTSQGFVATGNTVGDTTISVGVGAVVDSGNVTITYDLVVNSPLVAAVTQLSNQGVVTANGLAVGVLTDDTDAPGAADATVTPMSKSVLGDFVWNDLNGNGLQDGGAETGIQGVTFDAYFDVNNSNTIDGGDLFLGSATSDSGGLFAFGLPNFVEFLVDVTDTGGVLSGLTLTGGSDPVAVTVVAGGSDLTVDFGYQPQNGSIGDFIWNDLDGDGVQDGGEPGLAGITVYLDLNSNGVLDGGEPTATTNGSGAYDFSGLGAGIFSVNIDGSTVSAGFSNTTGNLPLIVNLAASQDFNDADFGFQQQDGSIGDFVWNDLDGDGVQDGGEPGLAGITVFLDLNSNGVLDGGEPSVTSNGSGVYDFSGLAAGTFSVNIDIPTVPSGFSNTTGNLPLIVNLAAGEDFNDADFGFQQQDGSIGDFVWNDLDGDGLQDGGEPGLAGITVYLDSNSNGALDGGESTATTNGAGAYDFTGLAAGTFFVNINGSTVPAGFSITSGNLPLTVNLAAGQDFNDADFGFQQQDGTIGDFVWNDLDGDGIQDGGEPGLAGITVYLDLNSNGVLDGGEPSTATNGTGSYDFTDLASGNYMVGVDASTLPAGLTFTTGNLPLMVNLAAGEDYNDADFGYQQQDASIGDYIWSDLNGDGIQDGSESGLAGVTVYLDQNANGVLDGGEESASTNGAGAYDFTGLTADTYTVEILESTVPAGFTFSTGNLPLTVNLTAGEDYNDADFGYQAPFVDVSVADNTVAEGNAGISSSTFTVTLSSPSALEVTVDYTTQDVSANAGDDYTATNGTVTFVPGDVSETVVVDVLGDAMVEPDETFNLVLNSPDNANLGAETGIMTIVNDDSGADLSVNLTLNSAVANIGDNVTYTMTVNNAGPDVGLAVEGLLDITGYADFIGATPSQGSCNQVGGLVSCSLGDINVGDSVTVEVNAILQTGAGVVGNASVSSPLSSDPISNNNQVSIVLAGEPARVPMISWLNCLMLICFTALLANRRFKLVRHK